MADYVTKIKTSTGEKQIDYNALANLPTLTPAAIGALPITGGDITGDLTLTEQHRLAAFEIHAYDYNSGEGPYLSGYYSGTDGRPYLNILGSSSDEAVTVRGIETPTYDTDAVNKKYVDDYVDDAVAINMNFELQFNAATLPSDTARYSVTYGNGKFVTVEYDTANFAYSTDGINWTAATLPSSAGWYSVTYGNAKFVAVANNSNKAAYSADGINWTAAKLPSTANWRSVTYGNGKFVAVANHSNKAAYSVVPPILENLHSIGLTRVETGSYFGTGYNGSSYPNSLLFSFEPKLLFIYGISNYHQIGYGYNSAIIVWEALKEATASAPDSNNRGTFYTLADVANRVSSMSENSFSWYCDDSAQGQLNLSSCKYFYIAIG